MESISHTFGEALRFACNRNKRGFQTKVGNLTSIDKANFCHILKGAGASEEKRRAIFAVVLDLDPTFHAGQTREWLRFHIDIPLEKSAVNQKMHADAGHIP